MPNRADISLIRKYLNGELDERTMYQLERRAQEDPALMDLMLGMEFGDPVQDAAALLEIQAMISKRTGEAKVVRFATWQKWSVAASILLISLLGILWLRTDSPQTDQVAQQSKPAAAKPEPAPAEPVDAQTLADPLRPAAEVKSKLSENKDVIASVIHRQKAKTPELAAEVQTMAAAAPIASADSQSSRLLSRSMKKIPMDSADNSLNEVVIVGYGAQKKAAVTQSYLKPDSAAASNALAGRVAGVETGSLNEVVVSKTTPAEQLAYRIRRMASMTAAEPANGWKAYIKYLDRKAKKTDGVTGEVTLTFNLDKEGVPVDIVVLTGLTDTINQRAIEILRKGAKWKRPEGLSTRLTLIIRFH